MDAQFDMSRAIIVKSDQINADDLFGGPITVRITSVRVHDRDEQPVEIGLEGRKLYRPCKTMCKLLVFAWGQDASKYAGRLLRLARDNSVMFGKMEVGGIRITHMSDIPGPVKMGANSTKGKKAVTMVDLIPTFPSLGELNNAIREAKTRGWERAHLVALMRVETASKVPEHERADMIARLAGEPPAPLDEPGEE